MQDLIITNKLNHSVVRGGIRLKPGKNTIKADQVENLCPVALADDPNIETPAKINDLAKKIKAETPVERATRIAAEEKRREAKRAALIKAKAAKIAARQAAAKAAKAAKNK